jgi:hypothetical protein
VEGVVRNHGPYSDRQPFPCAKVRSETVNGFAHSILILYSAPTIKIEIELRLPIPDRFTATIDPQLEDVAPEVATAFMGASPGSSTGHEATPVSPNIAQ